MPRPPMFPFNVLFTMQEKQALDALAEARCISRGQVLREMVRVAHQMNVAGVPLCANGSPCFVPQMHQLRAPAQPAAGGPMFPPPSR